MMRKINDIIACYLCNFSLAAYAVKHTANKQINLYILNTYTNLNKCNY